MLRFTVMRVCAWDARQPAFVWDQAVVETRQRLHRTLAYRFDKTLVESLPFALFLLLLGLSALAFIEDRAAKLIFPCAIVIATGGGLLLFGLCRRVVPSKPLLTLSPAGILFRVPWVKEFLIPWREIQAVTVRDVSALYPSLKYRRRVHFHDVTAVRVSKAFYDRKIHVTSFFLRGPGWSNTFFEDGDHVDVALHHELFSIPADELRNAVLARWHAFGGRDGAPEAIVMPAVAARRARTPLFTWPKLPEGVVAAGRVVCITLFAAGIVFALSNLLGVWEADYQREARSKRKAWQTQLDAWAAEEKREAEERRKRDAKWEEFWRKNRF
jgi:hypothetical protein